MIRARACCQFPVLSSQFSVSSREALTENLELGANSRPRAVIVFHVLWLAHCIPNFIRQTG